MIGRLTGTVVADDADGTIVLDVNGVGYELLVPLGTLGRARAPTEGDRVTLHVHTHVREDALVLFGFATPADRTVFRTLIAVSNVGPKTALSVLSALPVTDLAQAVANKDLAKLVAIPGIGKKTAERLLLELKGKLESTEAAPPVARPAGQGAPPTRDLLFDALIRMGYRPAEAERAVEAVAGHLPTQPMGDLLREALTLLAR